MPTILIAGRGFIARHVAAALAAPDEVRLVAYDAVDAAAFDGVATAMWGGRHPALGREAWRLEDEAEIAFAEACTRRRVHLVTLGTRKVYAPSSDALGEDAPTGPSDRYGEHKASIEDRLATVCIGGLTRLRLANIFGLEPGRATFMAAMCDRLLRGEPIRFDMSPFTRRDFLPVEATAVWIAALLRRPPGGIVNLGSGVGLECGRLALAAIEGYGGGRLIVDDWRERDAFTLDVGRLRSLVAWSTPDCLGAAREVGRRLLMRSKLVNG